MITLIRPSETSILVFASYRVLFLGYDLTENYLLFPDKLSNAPDISLGDVLLKTNKKAYLLNGLL